MTILYTLAACLISEGAVAQQLRLLVAVSDESAQYVSSRALESRMRLTLRSAGIQDNPAAPWRARVTPVVNCPKDSVVVFCFAVTEVAIERPVQVGKGDPFRPVDAGPLWAAVCAVQSQVWGGDTTSMGERIVDGAERALRSCLGELRY